MALGVVTEIDIHAAIKAKIAATGGWFTGKPVHFGRRPPNGLNPPYVVANTEEQEPEDNAVESDGAVKQRFLVEMVVRSIGPDDTEDAAAALIALDPRWYEPAGVTLTDTDKGIVGVLPKTGRVRLIAPLRDGGQDQYTAVRRWEIHTGALIGA